MAKVQNTDVLAVGRGSATYKATFQEVASSLPNPPDATAAAKGMVQLANAADVTAGTAGHVVDAAQLKAVKDAIPAPGAAGITGVTGTAPITASGTGTTRAIGITAATAAAPGAMSAADKSKLDGIAAAAEVNVQSDWTVTDNTSDAFIKNKPAIPAAYALPVASATVLGGIKKGTGYTIASDGKLDITFPASLTYKGTIDPTAAAPAAPKVGDVYIANKAAIAAASWTGLAPKAVALHELLVWDGTEWAGAGVNASMGVQNVTAKPNTGVSVGGTANAPVIAGINATEAAHGVVQLASIADATAGTNTAKAVTAAGVKAAIAALSGSASATAPTGAVNGNLWTDISGAVPVIKVYDGTAWHALAGVQSPQLTGIPTATTAAAGTNNTQLATTAFVQAAQPWARTGTTLSPKTPGDLVAPAALPSATAAAKGAVQLADAAAVTAGTAGRVVDAAELKAGLVAKADLASPALTGTPTAPTAAAGTNTTQLATTAFVHAAVAVEDLWDRTGTEITPKTAGDSVFTSGAVKVGGTTAVPNITLRADGEIKTVGPFTTFRIPSASKTYELLQGYGHAPAGGALYGLAAIKSSYEGAHNGSTLDFWTTPASVAGVGTSAAFNRASITSAGDFLLGGTLPASPAIKLTASGDGFFHSNNIAVSHDLSMDRYGIGTIRDVPFHVFTTSWAHPGAGVVLIGAATAWAPGTSESRLKDIQGDADTDQCWDLIRDIELKRYYYKDQDDKSGVTYMGPMADWLGVQDPELLIDTGRTDEHGPIHTFNQGLLDMKALAALSAALKRIEDLEADVAALKGTAPHKQADPGAK